jgi:hypothetical protein
MGHRMIEGTWEEVARRAHELTGRRVRVIVIDDQEEALTLDRVLAPLIAEAETLTDRLQAVHMPEPLPADAWSETVAEKFRRQGFEL